MRSEWVLNTSSKPYFDCKKKPAFAGFFVLLSWLAND